MTDKEWNQYITKLANDNKFCGACGKLCGWVSEEDIKRLGEKCSFNGNHGKT